MIYTAATLAQERRERGLKLNLPKAKALLEGARDGRTVTDLMDAGSRVLTRDNVMVGVPEMLGGDRPVQVGSHYHFADDNPGLESDRKAACGRRLNVPAGGSARFEPGAAEDVELIPNDVRQAPRA